MLNTQKSSRELSIEETLTRTFDLYSKNFVIFFIPMLIVSVISGGFIAIITNYFSTMPRPEVGSTPEEVWSWFSTYIVTLLAIIFIAGIIVWIISTIINGACIKCAADLIEKGKANLGEAFSLSIYKLVSLLAAAIVTGILIALGTIALIVPGIILAIMFSLVVPAIIIGNVGALDSLSRSKRLVSNRWLKTFALLLIVYIIIFFISYIGILVGSIFGAFGWLASSVIAAFVQPIIPISITVYYYSMLAKETQRFPPPPPPPF